MRFRFAFLLLLTAFVLGCGDGTKTPDPAKQGVSPNAPSKPGDKKSASW